MTAAIMSGVASAGRLRRPAHRPQVGRVVVGVCLTLLAIAVLFPLLWMMVSGFKTNAELFGDPWGLPGQWRAANYRQAWEYGVAHYIVNSAIVTLGSIVIVTAVSSFAAFALVQVRIPLGQPVLLLILGGLMLSPTVSLVPLFRIMQTLHLYNTLPGLVVLYVAFRVPFTTFLIRAYMLDLPQELRDAAVVDGASMWQMFWRVTLPLCRPVILSAAILQALFAWNEFVFALVFIRDDAMRTMPVGLMTLQSKLTTNWPVVFAGLTMAAIPMVVVFLLLQRHFVRGITEGLGK